MNIRDRLKELMQDDTPANAAGKAALKEMHKTGATTYHGKTFTLPGGPDRPQGTARSLRKTDGAEKVRRLEVSGMRERPKLQERIGGPSALERRDAERAAALLPTGLEAVGLRPDLLLTQPARVSPQELKGELMNRQHQGIYTMPGSAEETIANLEKRRDGLRQALEQARRQSEMDLVLNPATGTGERGAEVRRISDALAEAENTLWETKRARERAGLEEVTKAADFDRAVQAAREGHALGKPTQGSAWSREVVRWLTNEEYRNEVKENPEIKNVDAGLWENLDYLTPREQYVLLYYAGKGQFDKVDAYWEVITRQLNARRQGEASEETREFAERRPFAGGAYNVASSFFAPSAYLANLGQTLKNEVSGEYEPTDFNTHAFDASHAVDDTAAGVSKAAERMPLFGGMEVKGKSLGSFLAETGLSIGQFLSKVPLGGAGALAYIGAGAAGQGTLNTLERGGTPGQALALGTANGLIEVATEKIGLDNLLSIARRAGGNGVVHALLDIGGQALIEGSEEAVSEVANNIADLAVMGDKAELNQYVGQLMEQGMSREEAQSAALKQFFLANTAWAAAGGAVSGGVIGVGASVISGVRGAQETRANRAIDRSIDGAYAAMQENGIFSPEARSAQARANQRLGWLPTGRQGVMLDGRLPTGAEALEMEEAQQTRAQLNIVDSTNPGNYNREKGGVTDGREAYAAGGQETDPGGRVPGLPGSMDEVAQRGRIGRGDSSLSGFVLLSDKSLAKIAESGVVGIDLEDRSSDGAAFSAALEAARAADSSNGWAVTQKTPEELAGDKVLLSRGGTSGLAVTPDGDIVAVFNNKKAGGPKGATKVLIPTAIANGGVKLDCYGHKLVDTYARYGFVPVARVAFNPEFANEGWTPEKGTPDIYFMVHGGDSADAVVEKMGNYRQYSPQELEALPLMDYDEAAAYRDKLLQQSARGDAAQISGGKPILTAEDVAAMDSAEYARRFLEGDETDPTAPEAPVGREVDSAPAGPYDGIRDSILPGGVEHVGGGERAADAGVLYGSDVRGQGGEAGLDTGRKGALPEAPGGGRTVPSQTAGGKALRGWAQGHIVERPANSSAVSASEYARAYTPDVVVVEDGAIRGKNPDALALTADGVIYLSDAIPENLSKAVPHHEVVHWVKQAQNPAYLDFIDTVGGRLNMAGDLPRVLDVVIKSRFPGKTLFDLTESEVVTAYDELNAVVWGFYKDDPQNARAKFGEVFTDYDAYIAELDAIMEEAGRQSQTPGPEGSVGAAEAGFAGDYNRLQNQTGAKDFHPDGERRHRQVDVPKRDFEGRNISKSPATVMEAQAIPDTAIGEIQQMIADGKFSYDRNTDRGAMQRAERTIQDIGFDGAMERFHQAAREGKVGKDLMSLGATLLNNAANSRDGKALAQILSDYVSMSRAGAQATQANRLLKQMSPQWQLAAIERSVENIQSNLDRKYGEKAPSVQMDPALIEAYMNALNQPGRDKVAKQIYADVADQLPSTFADKWNAWRYVAMLTNPRTHVRNLVGSAGFAPVRTLKNMIGVGLEVAVQKTAGLEGRTKTVLGPGDIGLVKQAWADFGQVQDEAMGAGKWSEASGTVQQERTIFKNNGAWGTGESSHALARGARTAADGLMTGLEWVRRTNSKLMEAEDSIFLRSAYTTSLAGYLKANGVTDMASADPRLLDQARSYAVLEAQKATYRDSNAFSDWVAQLGRDTGGPAAKAGHFLMEGVLPFKRTPANILVRGMEYSPAGLVKGLSYDLYKVRKGRMTGTEAIDHIASGLTGTALLGLGMFLAASGAVTGGGDDDKKKAAMDDLTGGQNYALNVGNKSYTLDWMAPEALPFFMGVELFGQMQKRKGGGLTVKSALAAAERIADPMLEMSMLQGLQDIIDSVKYSDGNAFLGVLAGAAVNHLTQAVPTLFGQIERTTEEQRTSTYVDNASGLPNDLQYTLGKVFNKLPGEFQQIPYIDAWGRTHSNGGLLPRAGNNFLNPSFVSEKNITELDREALRLYEQLGDGGVLPDRAGKYVTVSGRRHDLSAEQYVKYATRRGQGAYSTAEAVVSSGLYQGLTEGQKAAAVQAAYSYADAVAKESLGLGYEPDKWVDKARLMNDEGRAAFLVARVLLADGETSGEKRDILRRADMPEEQKIQAYRMLLSDTKDEDIEAVLNTGLSFNDFLEAQNKQNEINNTMTKATAAERATEFAHWAHGEGYTEKQAAAVREAFGFYSFVPQDELRYDKLLGAGFPEDKAYELTGALADVSSIRGDKDANGKTVSLSASQKKKAAIDAATPGLSQQERRILYEMFDVSQKVW